ncbi:glycosyltransferase family 2 protein [archaeon]|nr:glycosyltransferase family 2 protein [archaeon]
MLELFLAFLFAILAAVHLVAVSIFLLPGKKYTDKYCPPVSIVIPAHNEEKFISESINSVIDAGYKNKKDIIVIDDGSTDKTAHVVRSLSKKYKNVRLFSIPHSGKANALNYGIRRARFDIIAYLDADSFIEKSSLMLLVHPLKDKRIAASSGVIRARRKGIFTWFQDVDYIVSSGWRHICNKVNSTYVTPGFAAFSKTALKKINGFTGDTLTEDIDITIRLRKAGFHAVMTKASIFTSVPSTLTGLVRQRIRWGRGSVQVAKKHSDIIFSGKMNLVGTYAFPMHLFWYAFAILYMPFAIYWFSFNYASQFASGSFLSFASLEFVIKWFTLYGIFDLLRNIISGAYGLTFLLASIILSWFFSFLYFVISSIKFGFTWRTFAAYVVIFPYYWLLLIVQAAVLIYEAFSRKSVKNKWNKKSGN